MKRKQMLARVEAWQESGPPIKALRVGKALKPASFCYWRPQNRPESTIPKAYQVMTEDKKAPNQHGI